MRTGAELRAWREARGLTQDQLAALTGLRAKQISAWETGERGRAGPPGGARTLPDHVAQVLGLLEELDAAQREVHRLRVLVLREDPGALRDEAKRLRDGTSEGPGE